MVRKTTVAPGELDELLAKVSTDTKPRNSTMTPAAREAARKVLAAPIDDLPDDEADQLRDESNEALTGAQTGSRLEHKIQASLKVEDEIVAEAKTPEASARKIGCDPALAAGFTPNVVMPNNYLSYSSHKIGVDCRPPRAPAIYAALGRIAVELARLGIGKDSKNESQRYNFRGVDAVYNVVGPLLAKEGVITLPRHNSREVTERESKNGGLLYDVTLSSVFRFAAVEDGSYVEVETVGEGMDSGDKATNKAMSVAHKYAVIQLFSIPVVGADDPDFESHETRKPNPRADKPAKQATKSAPKQDDMSDLERPEDFEGSEVERFLAAHVSSADVRAKIANKVCEAFTVMTLDQLTAEQAKEAAGMVASFIKKMQAKAAQAKAEKG